MERSEPILLVLRAAGVLNKLLRLVELSALYSDYMRLYGKDALLRCIYFQYCRAGDVDSLMGYLYEAIISDDGDECYEWLEEETDLIVDICYLLDEQLSSISTIGMPVYIPVSITPETVVMRRSYDFISPYDCRHKAP